MKIILWPSSSLPNIGGLEMMTHALAKQLKKEGHEILIVSEHMNSSQCKEMTIEGIRICLFPFTTALYKQDLVLIKTILTRIQGLFDVFLPDIVNVHGWFESFCFYQTRILEKRKIPLCITVHGLLEQRHYQTPFCLKLWTLAHAVNTVSQVLVDGLKTAGITHPQLRVIYNGLPHKEVALTALSIRPPRLLMIGRMSEEKCFDVAFYALKILLQKYPDMKLTLVGGGAKFCELSQLKNKLQLEDSVEMTDFIHPHDVSAYIDRASLVLVPSYYESFSLVALEAALHGRPVVASDVYGLREVVDHETTGILVPPQNPETLAKAIDQLLRDEKKMQAMGQFARKRAESLFGIEKTTQEYLKMYEEIRKDKMHAAVGQRHYSCT